MKSRNLRDDGSHNREGRVPEVSNNKKKKMKNMQRLGGAGLSLEAFANAKSRNNAYNPALLSMFLLSLLLYPCETQQFW